MELKVKDISPFAIHKLQAHVEFEHKPEESFTDVIVGIDYVHQLVEFMNHASFPVSVVKPLLRPFSQLTQEIEHNGEIFVPIQVLSMMARPKMTDYYWHNLSLNLQNNEYLEQVPIWIAEKLYAWHFDLFSLLEKNLAIEKPAQRIKQNY